MLNCLPHDVRARLINWVLLTTATLYIASLCQTMRLKVYMLSIIEPWFVVTGVLWHVVVGAFQSSLLFQLEFLC